MCCLKRMGRLSGYAVLSQDIPDGLVKTYSVLIFGIWLSDCCYPGYVLFEYSINFLGHLDIVS